MVEIGRWPMLWHIMKIYGHYGFTDFIMCLGYKGSMIKEYFLNYEAMNNDITVSLGRQNMVECHDAHGEQGFRITLADTGQETMTGARVKRIERYLDDGPFMVTYGDGLADVNIRELLAFHKHHGKLATLTTARPVSRFGLVETEPSGAIKSFVEKPQIKEHVNAGFLIFEKRALEYFSAEPSCILEREPLEGLARDGQLMAFHHQGFFFAMDTYREFLKLNELWASGHAPWKVWS